MILYFTYESCDTQKPFLLFLSVKTITKLNLELAVWFTFSGQRRIWTFHVLVLKGMAKKCTKKYDARARPLFCLLNLLAAFLCCRRGFLNSLASLAANAGETFMGIQINSSCLRLTPWVLRLSPFDFFLHFYDLFPLSSPFVPGGYQTFSASCKRDSLLALR